MNYKQYNDYELVYMVRENDDYSRSLLYDKYLPLLKKISYEFYSVYKRYGYDYDDFLQEAMLAFERAIIKYDDKQETLLYTFVNVCVRRSLITFCRNISNDRNNLPMDSFLDISKTSISDKVNIDEMFECKELEELCKKVILDLPMENSTVFELKINGFTYREIGVLLDIPSSTAEFKNRKAKSYFKKILSKYYCK